MAKMTNVLLGAFLGGLAGIAIGILTAPKSGNQSRQELSTAANRLYRKATYELEELGQYADELRAKIDEMKVPGMQPARRALASLGEAVEDFNPGLSEKIDQIQKKINHTKKSLRDIVAQTPELVSETILDAQEAMLNAIGDKITQAKEKTSQDLLKAHSTIEKAQHAIAQHNQTMAQSQQTLNQTKSPIVHAEVPGESPLERTSPDKQTSKAKVQPQSKHR